MTNTQADPWRITAGMHLTSMRSGWYEVTGSVVCSERIAVSGSVDLILGAGAALTASQGINVSTGNSLTISGSGGMILITGGTVYARGNRGSAGSPAETYCRDPEHANCVFVSEILN